MAYWKGQVEETHVVQVQNDVPVLHLAWNQHLGQDPLEKELKNFNVLEYFLLGWFEQVNSEDYDWAEVLVPAMDV